MLVPARNHSYTRAMPLLYYDMIAIGRRCQDHEEKGRFKMFNDLRRSRKHRKMAKLAAELEKTFLDAEDSPSPAKPSDSRIGASAARGQVFDEADEKANNSLDFDGLPPVPENPLAAASIGATQYDQPEFFEDSIAPASAPPQGETSAPAQKFLTFSGDRSAHPEVALLLDHLSLAKEENREILRLTQDAMQRVSNMTDQLVKLKDELLSTKDQQLTQMHEIVKAREAEILRLKRQNEDLETLARTLM